MSEYHFYSPMFELSSGDAEALKHFMIYLVHLKKLLSKAQPIADGSKVDIFIALISEELQQN